VLHLLQELDQLESSLNSTQLNATTNALYSRSVRFHHEQLFATLFPYVSRSPKSPRTFDALLGRYTRPRGIVICTGNDQFQVGQSMRASCQDTRGHKARGELICALAVCCSSHCDP
jgi:hypothetical protein